MRKQIIPLLSGLTLLLVVSWAFPLYIETTAEMWPREGPAIWLGWTLVVGMVNVWREFRQWPDYPAIPALSPVVEGSTFSIVGAIAAVQAWPSTLPLALLHVTAEALGKALFSVAIWPFVVLFFAYLIAPQRSLVQADHPVQYRDRENTSKFLLGAACLVLLYQMVKIFW